MLLKLKTSIRNVLACPLRPIKRAIINKRVCKYRQHEVRRLQTELLKTKGKKRIFYLGVTEHTNLGDLAQCYCITCWIENYCKDYSLLKYEATTIVDNRFHFIDELSKAITPEDVIVFQSGYTTQDLGGVHDLMHRMVADAMPDAHILMMPQTIFFKEEAHKMCTAKSLDRCTNMVFLARDFVSFETAKTMFPHLKIMAYPDIVTSLIGSFHFTNNRQKIYLCRRNDGEKYYSESELLALKARLSQLLPVDMGDTQSGAGIKQIRSNLRGYIETEIERYSHYKVVITDRYHGTIFSLCAGTPVIIIKTTDHKVTTGADWFKGVYDDYVFVAQDLEDAYTLAAKVINREYTHELEPYFEKKYYGRALRQLFNESFVNQ